MKKFILLWVVAIGLAATMAYSQTDRSATVRNFSESYLTTKPVPNDAGEGMSIQGLSSTRVSVCTASGQALDAGTLEAFDYDYQDALWKHVKGLDEAINVSNERCQSFGPREVLIPSGKRMYRPYGVLSTGDDAGFIINVRIKGWIKGQ